MPALCLMLSGTYYAKNYAGIIGRGLLCGDLISVILNVTKNSALVLVIQLSEYVKLHE